MKIRRKTTLGQALDEVSKVALAIKLGGAAEVDGHEFRLEDQVELEIEFEVGEGETELEFEIKWKRKGLDQSEEVVGME